MKYLLSDNQVVSTLSSSLPMECSCISSILTGHQCTGKIPYYWQLAVHFYRYCKVEVFRITNHLPLGHKSTKIEQNNIPLNIQDEILPFEFVLQRS